MTMRHAASHSAMMILLASGLAFPALAQTSGSSPPWVGTWAAAPQSGTENGASGTSFNGQTLRQTVYTSIGGSVAQIHVSNLFGTQKLTVSDVHMALPTGNGGIDTTTDKQLTFGGQSSVTIAAGSAVVSDPVAFPVPSLGEVSISMFLPDDTGPDDTQHTDALQTNYIVPGDLSGQASLAGATTTQSGYYLTGLDVQSSNALGSVVTLGASITDGYASTTDANKRWPNILAARLAQTGADVGVLNEGIAGNRLLADITGPSAPSRFGRDVLGQAGVRAVIFSDDPINDLGVAAYFGWTPPSSQQLIAGLQQLMNSAHTSGIKFICSTLTPYEGAGVYTPAGETVREQYNAFVRQPGNGCDAIVDQDAAVHDPQNPTRYLPAYDSGDHLHPNDAGYAAIAAAVNLATVSTPSNTAQ